MPPNTIRKPTPLDLSGLLFLTIVWASAFIAIKVAVPQTGPFWLAAIRVCIGFAVLLPWALYRGLMLPKSLKSWSFLLVVSLLNVAVPFLLISWAELTISAGVTSLLLGTGPLLALILSHLTTHDDKINLPKLIGISFGFTGIALVVGRGALADLGNGHILAQIAVLGASLCYALSGAMIRKITDIPPTRLATIILGMASVELVLLASIQGMPDFAAIDGTSWLSLIYLGLLPTGVATIMRYRLIGTIGASFFALGMNLIPIFGVLMGAVLLSEEVALTTWAALALIVLGLFAAKTPPKKPN
ncbi:DMT family transporter [Cohaesibacter sp. CAU 1516]|uniref:DMT family transporter n=1 Tax=Cohaesibacter sp. CAU 1516 TaxID=2576038 RepID=UPI0010FF21D1|nr:DMT family transporter [Cohaesibacter sp. CAU 1516]TLP48826.1 DMT family transporter [Cohaesibacter sp. CAU 1516]